MSPPALPLAGVSINLIFVDNGAGLTQDAALITAILGGAGAQVTRSDVFRWNRWQGTLLRRVGRWLIRPRYDINLFLEHTEASWFPFARRNVLIPNQEWFEPHWLGLVRQFDMILCKTADAERRFGALGGTVEFVGFTSRDRLANPLPPPRPGMLHVAGRSLQKGTMAVLEAWQRHPEWPQLTVVRRAPSAAYVLPEITLPNVTVLTGFVPDAELQALQNGIRLHVCPSEAEGFGHSLVESLSCAAILITTDAAPMNEIVTPERGLLAKAGQSREMPVCAEHFVDGEALEQRITEALAMPVSRRKEIGQAARAWFLENDRAFRERFVAALARQVHQRRSDGSGKDPRK